MDRNAFKQRMQALKSYRESNPGKGYWDWKVQSFEDGGEVSREQQAIQNALNAKGTPNQFMDTWNQARLATGNFNDQLGDGKLELQKANRDATAIYKSPGKYGFNSYLRGTPIVRSATMTEQEAIQKHVQFAERFGYGTRTRMQNTNQKGLVGTQITAGEYNPRGRAIYAPTEDVLTHEQAHASKAYPQENRIQEILGGENKATTDYLDRPTEVYSRLMDFREINNIDPNQVWDKKALKELKKTGTDVDLLNRYKDDQLLDLFNTVADIGTERNYDQPQYLAEGGEVGDPDDEFIQAVNTKLGRTPDGRPKEQGLKPVIDLEDVANVTPIGNALSAKDAYNAARNNDWLGVGLAGLGVFPMISGGLKKIAREIPTVTRTFERKVAEADRKAFTRRRTLEEYYDQRNRTYELINTPEARRRAENIDKKYGTEYSKVYDELTKEYENIDSYRAMPDPEFMRHPDAYAMIDPSKSKQIKISDDLITKPEDMPPGLIRHEIGHYVDEKAYPGGVPNNAYLRQLGKPSKYRDFEEVKDLFKDPDKALDRYKYLRMPTEKKSIMNQFDEYLMQNYNPSTYPTNTKQFREAIENAPDIYRNMKMLLKIHTKPSILFKDFQTRPIVRNINNKSNQEIV